MRLFCCLDRDEKKDKHGPWVHILLSPGQQVCFLHTIFVSYYALISHVADYFQCYPDIFFFANNEISGKDLRAVGSMLPEQPMRPIYLSSV